jgi:hypothetical protein
MRRWRINPHYRRNKLVAASGNINNITPAIRSIAEHLSKRCNMDPEIIFLHHRIRPRIVKKLFSTYYFAGFVDQRDEKI